LPRWNLELNTVETSSTMLFLSVASQNNGNRGAHACPATMHNFNHHISDKRTDKEY
jgi:hypothetical protein